MNLMATKFRSLAVLAAVATAAVTAGCSGATTQNRAQGNAKVGISVNALSATTIDHMTLTVSVDATSGAPSFANITTNLTNNDLTNKLSWSAYVQGIPAGTRRLFTINAYNASSSVIYSGSTYTDITAGNTASVYIVLQGLNDGGFQNSLPVVDSLTSSANLVYVGTTPPPAPVALTFKAHDPDSGATLTYAWASDCATSSFDAATGPVTQNSAMTVYWTPPTTAPSGGACTETLKITDNLQGTVTAYLAIQVQNNANGQVVVSAYPNSWPMISGIVANETFTKNTSGQIVSVEFDFVASATDPDGDDIKYTWSIVPTAGCNKPGDGYTSSTVTTPTLTLAQGQGQLPTSAVHYHTTDLGAACVFHVDVTDYWKDGIVPANSGLPVARGGDTLGVINGSLAKDFELAPYISHWDGPSAPVSGSVTPTSASFAVQGGQTINVDVTVLDPTPAFNPTELPFTFTWTQSGGALGHSPSGLPGENSGTSPAFSANTWTAPATVSSSMFVKVVVTNKDGISSSFTWNVVPANPCDGTAATVGVACATEPSSFCWYGLGFGRARWRDSASTISTGGRAPSAYAAKAGARNCCRSPRRSATRCSPT